MVEDERELAAALHLSRATVAALDAIRVLGGRAAYLMPDFQNPTGLLLDEDLRRRLAVGLEQAGVIAIVDETLVDLGLDTEPPVPFAGVTRPGSVVTVGSMSFWAGCGSAGCARRRTSYAGSQSSPVTRRCRGRCPSHGPSSAARRPGHRPVAPPAGLGGPRA